MSIRATSRHMAFDYLLPVAFKFSQQKAEVLACTQPHQSHEIAGAMVQPSIEPEGTQPRKLSLTSFASKHGHSTSMLLILFFCLVGPSWHIHLGFVQQFAGLHPLII